MKKTIISALIATTLTSLLSACGPTSDLVPVPGSLAPDTTASGSGATQAYRIQLVDENKAPLRLLTVAYGLLNRSNGTTDWKGATTDLNGGFSTSCTSFCEIEIQGEGYWPYEGPYMDPAEIKFAARTSEERNGKQLNLGDYELFRVHLRSQPAGTDIDSFADLFETDAKTRQSSFQVRSGTELDPVLSQLARLGPDTQAGQGSSAFSASPVDGTALMRKALSEGKRLVGYSNNEYFRYLPMVEELHQTADSYYFSENRTRLLSSRGMSGHSYDYELIVYALPADGKKVIFHGEAGKREIAP